MQPLALMLVTALAPTATVLATDLPTGPCGHRLNLSNAIAVTLTD